jgi:FtsP/CotA-like multicopper oxidase with cupredoxin domain
MFGVSDSYTGDLNSFKDFKLVATDGGYNMKPVTMKSLLTGPGARAEIVLDLSSYNVGDSLYLRNLKEHMPESVVGSALPGKGLDTTRGNAYLQIRIIEDPENYNPVDVFTPFTSAWNPGLEDTLGVSRHRIKRLIKMPEKAPGKSGGYTIDSTSYEMQTINDTICEGAKEIWTIDNVSDVAHPFHIHKIFFRILDIVVNQKDTLDLDSLGLNGPKDDILVQPYWKVRFMAKFDDYPSALDYKNSYMYHCHILTHEDIEGGGMMHQFVVTNAAQCGTTAVEEIKDLPDAMLLYPNPADNTIFLRGQSSGPSVVYIIDILGRTIKEQKLPAFNGTSTIDIDGMLKGFYLVRWSSNEGTFTKSILKE